MILILLGVVLFIACGQQALSEPPTSRPTLPSTQLPTPTNRPTATEALIPTAAPEPSPSAVPTSATNEEFPTDVRIPECLAEESQEPLKFYEAFEPVFYPIYEFDSYRYRTVYRFKSGDEYPDDQLSFDIFGELSGLSAEAKENPEFLYEADNSWLYNRMHTRATDLRTNNETEFMLSEDGAWLRTSEYAGWLALSPDPDIYSGEIISLFETFGPKSISIGFGSPGDYRSSEAPLTTRIETIGEKEVVYRCWQEDFGYQLHGGAGSSLSYFLTLLENVQVHLWTSDEDTRLVRLAITGKHTADQYHDLKTVDHDPAYDFLVWLEIFDVNQDFEIAAPEPGNVSLVLSTQPAQQASQISAPFNDLPLPGDAEQIDVEDVRTFLTIRRDILSSVYGSDDYRFTESAFLLNLKDLPQPETWEREEGAFGPRQFFDFSVSVADYAMLNFFGQGWEDIPLERRPVYWTGLSPIETISFYLDEMGARGWDLDGHIFQLGNPRYFLFFSTEQVTLPVIIEPVDDQKTLIWAILPPGDEVLAPILQTWQTFNETTLEGCLINTIKFDSENRAWLGKSFSGVSIFDGETWENYDDSVSEMMSYYVEGIAFDSQGRAWIGSSTGITVFDGATWTDYPDLRVRDIVIDQADMVWISDFDEVSVFDGQSWITYSAEEIGTTARIWTIELDDKGNIWAGTDRGSIFRFDGNFWEGWEPAAMTSLQHIRDILIDAEHRVWIGADTGVHVFDGQTWTTYNRENTGVNLDESQRLAMDQDGRLWVSTGRGSVHALSPTGEWTTYLPLGPDLQMRDLSASALAVDPGGNIWVVPGCGPSRGASFFTPPSP